MWTAAKLLALVGGAVLIVSAASRLAATRSRNAALTPIRYTAPFRCRDGVQIVELPSTLLGTIGGLFDQAGRFTTES